MIVGDEESDENHAIQIGLIMNSDRPSAFTLDQFVVFVTVVDQSGFAAAARHLGRAQSAITYAIKGLEEETGIPLFDRSAYRPALTEAGQTLLPRARRLVADLADYSRQARSITAGVEARLSVVSDVFAPVPVVAKALAEVHREYPSVNVKFVVDTPPAAIQLLRSGQAQVGVLSAQPPFGAELHAVQWTTHDLVPVAAPSHPLTTMRSIAPADLHGHMQLVWTAANAPANSPEAGVHALDRWYVTDLATKRALLLAGVGWGSLPDHLVTDDLSAGRLARLDLQAWDGSDRMPRYATVVAWRRDSSLGPAARHLIAALQA